uniref:EKC/KEOPS complex subunit GON7 n=1 Tax=Mycena chlorophos TaxID=658473 RepID=A0ABQ0KZP1_MYCCL|nr:predicted protein [Mycena chlorophos]
MTSAIAIEYKISPPAGPKYALPTEKKHTFPIAPSGDYYTTLREALANARDEVGKELTSWRDAVGTAEAKKEGKPPNNDEEEEEEEVAE